MDQTTKHDAGMQRASDDAFLAYARRVDRAIDAVCERQQVGEHDLAEEHGFTTKRWDELTRDYVLTRGEELHAFANALEVSHRWLTDGEVDGVTPISGAVARLAGLDTLRAAS